MKFMKLGSRPDTFYTTNGFRSISSEIRTDLVIQVNDTRYLLHKFPLLSKCSKLQRLGSETTQLENFPGGTESFELCAKFCYGITITISAYNIISARCAAEYLQMKENVEKGNLIQKLELFFNSCILNGWKDCVVTLKTTKRFEQESEEMEITSRCIESVVSKVLSNPSKTSLSLGHSSQGKGKKVILTSNRWWGDDLSELSIDLYRRIMVAIKSGGKVPANIIGDALKIYTLKWLPKISRNLEMARSDLNSKMLLESVIELVPFEKNSVSCSFLLKLLKAANVLRALESSRMALAKRVGLQLTEAKVCDLMIPSLSNESDTIYDLDIVLNILDQFTLQSQSQRRDSSSWSTNNGGFASSESNGSMVKVAKIVDGYLQEIARDVNLPWSKFVALTEAVPGSARTEHDDLYKAIDIYLKSHPDLNKNERKHICRTLDCKKLSFKASIHAAQNELLPLRVVVQVLFEQARATAAGYHLTTVPDNINALLATKDTASSLHGSPSTNTSTLELEDRWLKSHKPSLSSSTTKLEIEGDFDDGSSKVKQRCMIPSRPRWMFGKFWMMNRHENQD